MKSSRVAELEAEVRELRRQLELLRAAQRGERLVKLFWLVQRFRVIEGLRGEMEEEIGALQREVDGAVCRVPELV